jgi:hypothetical protein
MERISISATTKDSRMYQRFFIEYFNQAEGLDEAMVGRITETAEQIKEVAALAFPHWSQERVDRFVGKLSARKALTLTFAPTGEVVAFSAFKVGLLADSSSPFKVLYTEDIGVHPDYRNMSIAQRSTEPILDLEKPDMIAGCTGNPAYYIVNARLAAARGLLLYPESSETPAPLFELGKAVLRQFSTSNAELGLDPRLVKTRKTVASRGEGHFPLFDDVLQLTSYQQVLYLALSASANKRVVGSK